MVVLQHVKQFEELQVIGQNQPIINCRRVLEIGKTFSRLKRFHFTTFYQ